MLRQLITVLVLATFTLAVPTGCTTVNDNRSGAATGAAIGAATGALAGAVLAEEGSRAEGAIYGALAGALLGSVLGSYSVDREEGDGGFFDFDGSGSSAGGKVKIKEVSVSPAKANPGDQINLKATYTITAQRRTARVAVTEIREIFYRGDLVGRPTVNVTHTPGTYDSDIPLYLSRNAPSGTYKVVTTIRTADGSVSRETSFKVR